jgi:hypothetical protein
MANLNAPFGFRLSRHATGGEEERLSQYLIASGASGSIWSGDAVKSDGAGGVLIAADSDAILGVFRGCRYVLSDGSYKFSPKWTSGTTLPSGTKAYALVNDDPFALFEVLADNCDAADQGLLFDVSPQSGSDLFGQSRSYIDTQGGDQFQAIRVIQRAQPVYTNGVLTGYQESDVGDFAIVEGKFINHVLAGSAYGLAT